MPSIFSYVFGPSGCPPWRSVFRSFAHFLIGLFGVESYEFFIYFGDQTLVQGIIGKNVFPYGWIPFHFANVFFSSAEAYYMNEVPFVYSFLCVPCSRGSSSENIAVWNIRFSYLCFSLGLLWCQHFYLSLLSTLNLFLCMV